MEPLSEPTNTVWPFPFTPQDWAQTPLLPCKPMCAPCATRWRSSTTVWRPWRLGLTQNSTTSIRPPSSDSPYKKPRQHTTATTPRKAGGKPGHPGHRQVLLPPTTVREVRPERCACGNTTLTLIKPYYTHQVLELPPIAMEVTHWVLHQGWCPECGRWIKRRCRPSMPVAMDPASVPSWANWPGPMATAAVWCKPFVPRCCRSPSAWGPSRKSWIG